MYADAVSVVASNSARNRRRTQAEQSTTTRERLLNAAIECLVEDGCRGPTRGHISERAGLPGGARLHRTAGREAV
jgi:DNA-binding transcriptional regulator YbjK